MDSTFMDDAAAVRSLLRGFAGAQAAADAFEKVGTLQQAGDEAQARLTALQPQITAAQAELEALRAERDVAAADQRATTLLAEAKAQADEVRAAAQRDVEAATATRDALAAEADALRDQIAELKANAARSLGLT